MIALTDQQLQDFQEAVNWEVGERLPDGRILGSPEKRRAFYDGRDPRVALITEQLDPADKTVLELGPGEGHLTVQLAHVCKHVTAIEARPKNIVCALIRSFIHDVPNVRFVLGDVDDLDSSFGKFDILFHVGLLYHLRNPVVHLHNLRGIADYLLLDTHYCPSDDQFPRADIEYHGKVHKAFRWKEGAWNEPWAGVTDYARWLHRDTLFELLNDIGFDRQHALWTYQVGDLHRLTVLAGRSDRPTTRDGGSQAVASPPPTNGTLRIETSAATSARLRLLESELVSARREVTEMDKLREQIAAMRESWTWKIGRAAIESLHYLKDSFERITGSELGPPAEASSHSSSRPSGAKKF
jgi:tRNA (mo5U34)-methyltransferase